MKLWNAFIIFFLYSLIHKENKTRERECQLSFIIPCILDLFRISLAQSFETLLINSLFPLLQILYISGGYIFRFWPSTCIAESEFFPDRVIQPNSWQSQQWTHYMSVNHSGLTFGLPLNRVRMVPNLTLLPATFQYLSEWCFAKTRLTALPPSSSPSSLPAQSVNRGLNIIRCRSLKTMEHISAYSTRNF